MNPSANCASFYHDESNAEAYIESRRGLDGREIIKHLASILEAGSRVLELGMGPGTDLLILSKIFNVTGSDYSSSFLDNFQRAHADIEVIELDAVSIPTTRKFDSVFSNKVLHHLSFEDLRASLIRQTEVVVPGGIIFHSFWLGNEETTANGLRFAKYTPDAITDLFSEFGEVIITREYAELNASDSFFAAARI